MIVLPHAPIHCIEAPAPAFAPFGRVSPPGRDLCLRRLRSHWPRHGSRRWTTGRWRSAARRRSAAEPATPPPPAPPPPPGQPPPPPPPPPAPGASVVLVGAGDIANGGSAPEATAKLLDDIP